MPTVVVGITGEFCIVKVLVTLPLHNTHLNYSVCKIAAAFHVI